MLKTLTTKTLVVALGLLFITTAAIPAIRGQGAGNMINPPGQHDPLTGPLTPLMQSAAGEHQTPDGPLPLSNPPLVVHLPTSPVTMVIGFQLHQSYLNTTLSNVPTGYDVTNHWNYGWCGDYYHYITPGTQYQTTLYSTYDPNLPSYCNFANWSRVNYVLNHKVGTAYQQIQCAIWYLLNCGNQGLNNNGWTMVNAALANGTHFIPAPGQICAVLCTISPTVQATMIECIVPARTLTTSVQGQGTITTDPTAASYVYGQDVTLTATPSLGWSFDHWTGGITGNANPATITMNGDKTVTAVFTQNQYSLTASLIGSGNLTLNPTQTTYTYGQTVSITAQAQLGWTFDHWTGDASGTTNPVQVTITGNTAVTAVFTQNAYTLTVTTDGSGAVTQNPLQTTYTYGQTISLTATADPGWQFNSWTGDATGSANPTSVTITGNKAVTAHFTQDHYTLTVTPDGSGTFQIQPQQTTYTYGTSVQITAIPDLGWTFDHWTGDASGTSLTTQITMTGDTTVTGVFTQNHYTLTLNIDGSGTVTQNPLQTTYTYGQTIHLTATADPGWTFESWTGDVTSGENPLDITITADTTLTAHFTQNHYFIAVTLDGTGTVTKTPDQTSYTYGQTVQLTATTDPGWTFTGWTGDATGSQTTITLTVTDDLNIIAHFTQDQYTLTVTPDGQGTFQIQPQQTTYTYGTSVQITALPDLGWTFDHWTGDASGTSTTTQITMTGDTTVTGVFTQNHYTLTLNTDGSGTITAIPDQDTYTYGQTVHLTATPSPGYSFADWTGDASGTATDVDLIITSDMTATAHFTQDHYTLGITITGSGTVAKNPDQTTYTYGQQVTLTATASPGWTFDHWTGAASGTTSPIQITITGNTAVTAVFTQNDYTLTVTTDGSGSVTTSPSQSTYTYGQTVQLTASASQGWQFSYWSGDATGSQNPVTITITNNAAVTAHFTQNDYTLTVDIDGAGTVQRSPDQNTYTYGQQVTLTALPDQGYSFDHWSGGATGSQNPVTITITDNTEVTAHFTQNQYTLTVTTDGNGSVQIDPYQDYYTYGQTVTLTATADPGWTFDHWSGDISGSDNPLTFTIDDSKLVTATFTQNQYTLTVTCTGNGTVTTSPQQATYIYGQQVTLTANPDANWSFSQWTGDATGTTNPLSVTVTGDMSITAVFTMQDLIPPYVNITQPANGVYLFDKMLCPFMMPLFFHNITVTVEAIDTQSGVNHVEIFVDNVSKANLTSAPYRWVWSEQKPMKHMLKVVAFDNAGNSAKDEVMVWRWRFHPVIVGLIVLKAIMEKHHYGHHPDVEQVPNP